MKIRVPSHIVSKALRLVGPALVALVPKLLQRKKRVEAPPEPLPKPSLIQPLENIAVNVLELAIKSALRKIVRTVLATLLAVSPQIVAAFRDGAAGQDLVTQGVFGLIVAGLVGLFAFVERYLAVLNAKPVT